jgi:hypothetical protein
MRVQVAGSSSGIERRARLVVGEIFEVALGSVAFAEKSGREFARKVARDSGEGFLRALANASGACGIGVREFGEAFAEACGVELIDSEDADAARSATWATEQEVASAAGGVGEGPVEDVDELMVASGPRMGDGLQV